MSVLLIAIRDEAKRTDQEELAEEIDENYLINKCRKALERYKLVPRTGDRELFTALVDSKSVSDPNSRISLSVIEATFRGFACVKLSTRKVVSFVLSR